MVTTVSLKTVSTSSCHIPCHANDKTYNENVVPAINFFLTIDDKLIYIYVGDTCSKIKYSSS